MAITYSPLCGSEDLMMTDFNPLQHQHQHQQPLNPALVLLPHSNAINNCNSNHLSTPISQSFQSQRGEVDHYIRCQNEKLRMMLQEQRKQQVAALLKKVEMDAVGMLRQKDEEIAEAAKKRAELEEFLRRVEADNAWWRRVAKEEEAMVMSLHNTLEQMKDENGMEAESCCGEVGARKTIMVCRRCKSGRSCFMFLPCRHLCSCKPCEPFLHACPVCRMPKKSSIETLLF